MYIILLTFLRKKKLCSDSSDRDGSYCRPEVKREERKIKTHLPPALKKSLNSNQKKDWIEKGNAEGQA